MRQKILLMLIALICYASASLGQTTFIVDDLKYSIKSEEEKTCVLTNCPDGKIDVVVPQEVAYSGTSYKVIEIGKYAFYLLSSVESVVLPGGLLSIGENAFQWCDNLKSINLPEGLTSIGESGFSNCQSLTSIDLPNTLTSIERYTFAGCRGLTSIDLPNSITSIGEDAFGGCVELSSINLPKNLTSLGTSAFSGCTKLTSIEIPNSITTIPSYCFLGCSSLTSIDLPNKIVSIDDSAFADCSALIYFDMPNTVTSIGKKAFSNCSALISIDLSNSLTSIGEYAFESCTMLKYMSLPQSVTSTGIGVFSGCSELVSVDLPASMTSINGNMFSGCSALPSIDLPASITSIGGFSFEGCSALTSIDLPNTLTTIGRSAFSKSGLEHINLPNSIVSIGDGAFEKCNSLEVVAVNMDSEYISLGDYIFSGPITTVIYNTKTPYRYASSLYQNEDAILYVPQEIIEKIKDLAPWNKFKNVQVLPEMSLNSDSIEMWTGVDGELNVEVTPEEMPFGKVEIEWSSKERDIISLDIAGNSVRITPLSGGDATIDCVLKWGEVWKPVLHCNVTVKETLKGLKIETEKETIFRGKSLVLSTELEPLNSYYKDITWTSSDESIAQVLPSTNGRAVVKGLKAGTVTITAEAGSNEEGGYAQDSIEITVIQPVESIYLDPAVWEAVEGETLQLTVTILPEDATDKTLEWSSSDDEIATVDETGLVSVLKEGNCVITARTTDGSDLTAECHISITTGVEEIAFDSTATVDVFTLDGVKIKSDCKRNSLDDLTSGIYLLRKGNKVEKLIIH